MRDTGGKVLDHLPVFSDVTPCQFDSDLRNHSLMATPPSLESSTA